MNPNWFTDIPGYEPTYKISRRGTVISLNFQRTGKCKKIKPVPDKDGYQTITLCKNGKPRVFKLHRLVGFVFLPNPNKLPEINHGDGIKENNDVRNLVWCTRGQNNQHAIDTGLKPKTTLKQQAAARKNNLLKRKPVYKYSLANRLIADYVSLTEASQKSGVDLSNISAVCRGKVKTAGGFIWSYIKK